MADVLQGKEVTSRVKTQDADVGHVAPTLEKEHAIINTLVIRPQYRISIRLGEFEDLFANKPDTPEGRRERMQVLGLFYLPLKHKKVKAAYDVAWDHYMKVILTNKTDQQAQDDMLDRLKKWVVPDGKLPPAAEDPDNPKPENFTKIRFPGGYTFINALGGAGRNLNHDKKYALDFGSDNHGIIGLYQKDNPALHRVPLVAKVEKRYPWSKDWVAAPNVTVYFQLVPPYKDLPAFVAANSVQGQISPPPLRNRSIGPNWAAGGDTATAGNGGDFGPKGYAKKKDPSDPDGNTGVDARKDLKDNPQALNCPKEHGGRNSKDGLNNGKDVANIIFSTSSYKGFNTKPVTKHKDYPVAQAVTPDGDKHKHAVKAQTNDDGEAGVIFRPSWCGGDRYRIRAYVGPRTLGGEGSDGTGVRAVSVDTGTLVVWRSIRFSRYVRQPAGANAWQELRDAFAAGATDWTYRARINIEGTSADAKDTDLPTLDLGMIVPADVGQINKPYDRVGPQFARAYCELELDPHATDALVAADWRSAVEQAIKDMKAARSKYGLTNIDVEKLFYGDRVADGTITMSNCMVNLPMRSIADYNAEVPATKQLATAKAPKVVELFEKYGRQGFLRYFSRDGYLPGLTIIQGGFGCTWQLLNDAAGSPYVQRYGGVATEYRAAYDWMGGWTYPSAVWITKAGSPDAARAGASYSYDFTSTCIHEMGHLLYRMHAPGKNGVAATDAGTDTKNKELHDPLADSICLMAYKRSEGQLCAKCLFALRGWKLAKLTEN